MTSVKDSGKAFGRTQDQAKPQSWLWPDTRAPRVSILRDEHNAVVNAYSDLLAERDALRSELAETKAWTLELGQRIADVEAQRDDLLAALEGLAEGARQVTWKLGHNHKLDDYEGPARITRQDATVRILSDALDAARAAIERVKGRK